MSDATIVLVGIALVVLAVPDVRTAAWMHRVAKRYPSLAIDAYKVAMYGIAGVGVIFALLGLNSALALLFTDQRTILPSGAGLLLILAAAFGIKVPGVYFRRRVRRLEYLAENGHDPDPEDLDPRVPR